MNSKQKALISTVSPPVVNWKLSVAGGLFKSPNTIVLLSSLRLTRIDCALLCFNDIADATLECILDVKRYASSLQSALLL